MLNTDPKDHTGEKAVGKGYHPGFKTQGKCHQKSNNTGVSVVQKETCVLQF